MVLVLLRTQKVGENTPFTVARLLGAAALTNTILPRTAANTFTFVAQISVIYLRQWVTNAIEQQQSGTPPTSHWPVQQHLWLLLPTGNDLDWMCFELFNALLVQLRYWARQQRPLTIGLLAQLSFVAVTASSPYHMQRSLASVRRWACALWARRVAI